MIRINCYAANKGWLFSDIQKLFANSGCEPSEYPTSDADAWIAVRSSEARKSPDIRRTVIQVHNMEPHDIDLFNKALGVVFCHPMQHWLWKREGFKNHYIIRPIGARENITPSASIPVRPTIGFFCGENRERWKGSDVFEKAVRKARNRADFDCLLVGRGLSHIEELGTYEQHAAEPADYARIDALFCASISPGVPLSVFEACAAGKTVISTSRWFPKGRFPSVRVGDTPDELARIIVDVVTRRDVLFENRLKYASAPYNIQQWVERAIAFTERRYRGSSAHRLAVAGNEVDVEEHI